jgi:hypothetical protein
MSVPPLRLPARPFALAWANVFLAASDNDDHTALFRTVLIERYGDDSVRLVATDTRLLLQSWVSSDADEPPPGLDVLPDATHLVGERDGLAKAFVKHVLDVTKDDDDNQHEVRLRPGPLEDRRRPTFPEMAPPGLTMLTNDHGIELPIIEAAFPSWRHLWPHPSDRAAVTHRQFDPESLAVLARLRSTFGTVDMTFHSDTGPTVVTVTAQPPLSGLILPPRQALDPDAAATTDLASTGTPS